MQRSELNLSDQELVSLVGQHWGFYAQAIRYIDIGCAFAFMLEDSSGTRVFLKIHLEDKPSDPVESQTPESLIILSKIIDDLRNKYQLDNIPVPIKTKENKYLYQDKQYIFLLEKFIVGSHPTYEPNMLKSEELASIFTKLHAIDASEYPQIKKENFDITYALGLEKWFNIRYSQDKITQKMLNKLFEEKSLIILAINKLRELKSKLRKIDHEFVLTHGDAHHFNVLQNDNELFLLDWENLKIGPRERDLWHYDQMMLIDDYLYLNPSFTINYELFRFYQLQRFLEDLRVNLEKQGKTEEQNEENLFYFLYQRSWEMFYRIMT